MSQISNALRKIAESRQKHQDPKMDSIVYLTDTPKAWPKTALIVFLTVGIVGAILISISALTVTMKNSESKEIQVLSLERTIKSQQKRIDEFISAINKNQKFTDSQIGDLSSRLNKESNDTNVQINDLASTENSHYSSLKDAILDTKQAMDSLDKYTKTLDQKIEAISVSNAQVKDITNPVIGN